MSLYLAQKEKQTAVSKEICFLAAIFHDVFKEEENHEVKGGNFARKILKSLKYKQDVIEKVAENIAYHNNHDKILRTIESKILWDADKLCCATAEIALFIEWYIVCCLRTRDLLFCLHYGFINLKNAVCEVVKYR